MCAVNNAGRNVRKPTLQYTEEDYQAVMGTNLQSAFSLCQVRTSPVLVAPISLLMHLNLRPDALALTSRG